MEEFRWFRITAYELPSGSHVAVSPTTKEFGFGQAAFDAVEDLLYRRLKLTDPVCPKLTVTEMPVMDWIVEYDEHLGDYTAERLDGPGCYTVRAYGETPDLALAALVAKVTQPEEAA